MKFIWQSRFIYKFQINFYLYVIHCLWNGNSLHGCFPSKLLNFHSLLGDCAGHLRKMKIRIFEKLVLYRFELKILHEIKDTKLYYERSKSTQNDINKIEHKHYNSFFTLRMTNSFQETWKLLYRYILMFKSWFPGFISSHFLFILLFTKQIQTYRFHLCEILFSKLLNMCNNYSTSKVVLDYVNYIF